MANLRRAARGRECKIRIPGICNGNPETSVLAHIRLAGTCGIGMKPPDILAAVGCNCCHDAVDGRIKTPYSREELHSMHADGVLRTQIMWLEEGLISA
ncbi:DUF1364 domain-containing protein [Enterobacteriaceae bacterium 4M9]|nr:DUF1364 domain-containing protein [Enterobacteriaceae bacterium 4M9]